jgi:hypothetical protein
MIFTHSILLGAAFSVRYNALYYPFIGGLAFLLSRQHWLNKLIGIALPILLIGWFVFFTKREVAKVSGEPQFSPFGAWKLANDALYVYAHVDDEHVHPPPLRFSVLDSVVRQHFRLDHVKLDLLTEDPSSGSYFMLDGQSPLKKYVSLLQGNKVWGYREWLAIAPFYQSYGLYLVKEYPLAFARYFCWPNFIRYCNPPREVFGSPLGFFFDPVHGRPYVQSLFGLEDTGSNRNTILFYQTLLRPYSLFIFLSHLIFLVGEVGIIVSKVWRELSQPIKHCLVLILCLWSADFVFSILSAGVVLRYQLFMFIVEISFGLYCLNIVKNGKLS